MSKFARRIYFLLGTLGFLPFLLIGAPIVIVAITVGGEKRGGHWAYLVMRYWSRWYSVLMGVGLQVEGAERIADTPVGILVSNHRSYWDGIATMGGVPRDFRPLGKIEIGRIPLFGAMYRRVVVIVDRKNHESRKHSFEELLGLLGRGISVLIFPEGTANTSAEPLLPFKDGAFRLAIETGAPVLPMVILGSSEVMSRQPVFCLWRGSVTVRFGDPIMTDGFTADSLPALRQQVEEAMLALMDG